MAREPTRLISLRIPTRVSARLARLSKKRGVSVSAIVREAIEDLVDSGEPSAWEMGAHIWGQVKGKYPRDLSTNKKHLRGLGR
jgi:hypothetical protein